MYGNVFRRVGPEMYLVKSVSDYDPIPKIYPYTNLSTDDDKSILKLRREGSGSHLTVQWRLTFSLCQSLIILSFTLQNEISFT